MKITLSSSDIVKYLVDAVKDETNYKYNILESDCVLHENELTNEIEFVVTLPVK